MGNERLTESGISTSGSRTHGTRCRRRAGVSRQFSDRPANERYGARGKGWHPLLALRSSSTAELHLS